MGYLKGAGGECTRKRSSNPSAAILFISSVRESPTASSFFGMDGSIEFVADVSSPVTPFCFSSLSNLSIDGLVNLLLWNQLRILSPNALNGVG